MKHIINLYSSHLSLSLSLFFIYIFFGQFFNCYLTWLFIRPLTGLGTRDPKMDWKRSRLYKLARRTLVASIVSLTVSFCNVGYVVISDGHQRGLICLTMCTVDVTVSSHFCYYTQFVYIKFLFSVYTQVNVVTVHWVTYHI